MSMPGDERAAMEPGHWFKAAGSSWGGCRDIDQVTCG
jgi:hypothetical protein